MIVKSDGLTPKIGSEPFHVIELSHRSMGTEWGWRHSLFSHACLTLGESPWGKSSIRSGAALRDIDQFLFDDLPIAWLDCPARYDLRANTKRIFEPIS